MKAIIRHHTPINEDVELIIKGKDLIARQEAGGIAILERDSNQLLAFATNVHSVTMRGLPQVGDGSDAHGWLAETIQSFTNLLDLVMDNQHKLARAVERIEKDAQSAATQNGENVLDTQRLLTKLLDKISAAAPVQPAPVAIQPPTFYLHDGVIKLTTAEIQRYFSNMGLSTDGIMSAINPAPPQMPAAAPAPAVWEGTAMAPRPMAAEELAMPECEPGQPLDKKDDEYLKKVRPSKKEL